MKRLTTDNPKDNFETVLNYVFGQGGWAYIRHDGLKENVPLTEWAKNICLDGRGDCGDELAAELFAGSNPEEDDDRFCECAKEYPYCPVAMAYLFASQAVHMRDRLKMYEDACYSTSGKEQITIDQLQSFWTNEPLSVEDVKSLPVKSWVWIEILDVSRFRWKAECAYYRSHLDYTSGEAFCCGYPGMGYEFEYEDYGKTWLAYRQQPI